MNKIKLFIASMLGAIALVFACVLGTRVNAGTVNDVYKADLTTITENAKTVTATVVGGTKTMSFTATTHKTGASVTGISLITGSSKEFTTGAKMASSDTVTFVTTHSWSASILFAVKQTSSKVKGLSTSNGTITNPTVSAANTLYTATISSGTAGNVTISRDGDKETWIFEIIVTETYDSSVTYRDITYYDSDKTTVLDTDSVADGSKLTAPSNPVSSSLGQEFDCWVDSDGNEFDFANTTITSDLSLYASYKTDANYAAKVENANKLSNGIIQYMNSKSISSTTREIKATNTIFSIGNKWSVEYKESNTTVGGKSFNYDLKVGGKIQKDSQYIKVEAPSKGYLYAYVKNASSSAAATLSIDDYGTQTVVKSAGAIAGNATATCIIEVPAAGDYSFGVSDGNGVYVYELEFVSEIKEVASLNFDAQYDNDGTAATKLRFIGTIKGIAPTDYKKIHSITFTFTFNEKNRTCEVTELYKCIKISDTEDLKKAADNKIYFVYQLDNINKSTYVGKSLTNCKLKVVFVDDSFIELEHDDITLPASFENYVA